MFNKIQIELKGLGLLVEELKQTRVYCYNEECMNNAGWKGRQPWAPSSGKCLLPLVGLDKDGKCEYVQTKPIDREE